MKCIEIASSRNGMSARRSHPAVVTLRGRLYVCGGFDGAERWALLGKKSGWSHYPAEIKHGWEIHCMQVGKSSKKMSGIYQPCLMTGEQK